MENVGKRQEGAVAVIVAVMLTVLLGFVGLAMDVGNLVSTKTRMQNAVDAAAYAGGLKLTSNPPTDTDQTNATNQANSILQSNGFTSVTLTVDSSGSEPNTLDFNTDSTFNPSGLPEINLRMAQSVPTHFMSVLGISSVSLNASAKAVQTSTSSSGPFKYTLFSGDPTYTLTINGGNEVGGGIHSNGKLLLNGNVKVLNIKDADGNVKTPGDAEGGYHQDEGTYYGVTANGNIEVDGAISADTVAHILTNGNVSGEDGAPVTKTGGAVNDIAMPDFSDLVSGIPGIVNFSGNKTYNNTAPATSIFVDGNVILNGNITNVPGAIVATGTITVNGSVTLNSGNQVCLYSYSNSSSAIVINGNTTFNSDTDNSIIYAPNGKITFNGSNNDYNGKLIAKKILINGAAKFHGAYDFTAIPGASSSKKHVKLIK